MTRGIWRLFVAAVLACLALAPAVVRAAGAAKAPAHADTAHAAKGPTVAAPEPFYHLKYADSLSSVNDRCVVTHNRLNPAIHPLYVNGRPVGFC